MKKSCKKIFLLAVITVLITTTFVFSASAAINWGTGVYISSYGQVVNSITFKGVTVNAIYAPRNQVSNYDSNSTFCCAAFVSKFYRSVYGIGVNNLIPGNTPRVYSGDGFFYKTTTPQVGDIAASSGHWAIVKSVSGNTVTLIEQNAWTNNSYTHASVNRKLILPESSYWFWRYSLSGGTGEITTPTISLSRNTYYVGDKVNITWAASDKVTDFYQYWLIIKNNTTNTQYYAGATGEAGDYTKNSYNFTIPTSGNYSITVYSVPYNDKNTREKVATKSFEANTKEMTVPTISSSKSIYITGDTVDINWKATSVDSDFYQYWIVISDPNKKTIVNNATGDANDVTRNSYTFVATDEGEYTVNVWAVPYFNKSERQKFSSKTITVKNKEDCSVNGHSYTSETTKSATYSATGIKTYTCSKCGYEYIKAIAKKKLGTTSEITASRTSSSVTLTWNKVSGATGYRVYRKTSSGWLTLGETTNLAYTNSNLSSNTKYTFAVKAYVIENGNKIMAPKYATFDVTTSKASSSNTPAQVKNVKASSVGTTSVNISWSKVSGSTGYYIFSYNTKTGKYTSLGRVSGTSCTVKKLYSGTEYRFAVQAYKTKSGKTYWGKKSSIIKVVTKLATPTVKLTTTKGKAHLSWADIRGESGYAIYMSTSKNGTYTHLSNYRANSTKATKSKLKSGRTYYFKIRAYKTVDGKKVYGGYSAVKGIRIK